jgi:epoxyqueuosine reductase
MTPVVERLLNMIEEQGWQGQIVPIDHLADLESAIRGRHESGLFDEALYRGQLSSFSFDPPADLPSARSIIIVAVPAPQMRVFFRWQGNRVPIVIPPTHVSYTPRTESVQAVLATWLEQLGYRLAKPRLPLKTLAVHSGLAEYGRNNMLMYLGLIAILSGAVPEVVFSLLGQSSKSNLTRRHI